MNTAIALREPSADMSYLSMTRALFIRNWLSGAYLAQLIANESSPRTDADYAAVAAARRYLASN